jgi:hypothetical protein
MVTVHNSKTLAKTQLEQQPSNQCNQTVQGKKFSFFLGGGYYFFFHFLLGI